MTQTAPPFKTTESNDVKSVGLFCRRNLQILCQAINKCFISSRNKLSKDKRHTPWEFSKIKILQKDFSFSRKKLHILHQYPILLSRKSYNFAERSYRFRTDMIFGSSASSFCRGSNNVYKG